MPRMSSLLRIVTAKISATIINKYGDNGSPCLTPLSNSKYGVLIPLFNTQATSYAVIKCFYPSHKGRPKTKSIQAF